MSELGQIQDVAVVPVVSSRAWLLPASHDSDFVEGAYGFVEYQRCKNVRKRSR